MMPFTPSPDDIIRRATDQLFQKRLLTNINRAVVVEAIVAFALEPEWTWCSQDYSSHDFVHDASNMRLEVKQSAVTQTWNSETKALSRCQFDIAVRTGEYVGSEWRPGSKRNADIYVFAHHPLEDFDLADHRDPNQWEFFVLPENKLPAQQATLAIGSLKRLAAPVPYATLRNAVEDARNSLAA
jgi:hypothetical protein